jgi:RNA polymerase sigma-70 factor (sigma-E family)
MGTLEAPRSRGSVVVDGEHAGPSSRRVDVPALYTEHWRNSLRLAVFLTGDRATAEDVVQDAFVALYRNQANLRDPDAAVGYLRVCIVNISRSLIRRHMTARKHLRALGPTSEEAADVPALLAAEHQRTLAAVRSLPRAQREVVVLRYWGQLSEAQIAATLGISPGTVKSTASRGLARLRTALEHRHD